MELQEYLNNIPENRKTHITSILRLIKSLYPKVEESMRYKMPTYSLDDGWVAVANQKNYISLYTCSPEHIESFKAKHPNIKTGKGCINFKDKDNIPLQDLEPVIKRAIEFHHEE